MMSLAGILSGGAAWAQLIPAGQPVPKTAKPPVVFLNGYNYNCGSASFSSAFGIADQVMQANGQVSLFFNYCSVPGSPSIEDLGVAFGAFLSKLSYTGGQPVDRVDVVAHSLGGLIIRSYLSGKLAAAGAFNPPAVTHLRKVVFVSTPHFGTGIGLPFGNTITNELSSGSRFLFDLATWNQGTDDLRGVDAIALIGNGGTGSATTDNFDDGVIALTSASLGFYLPGRTRVVKYCHVDGGGLISLSGYCDFNALGIAVFRATTQDPARIIMSFLNDTADWQSIGVAAEQNALLAANGGLYVTIRSANDTNLRADSINAASMLSGKNKQLNLPSNDVGYTDMFPAGQLMFTAAAGTVHVTQPLMLPAGTVAPIILKPGPTIARVLPAAASLFPLSVAPGMIVAVYGISLAVDIDSALGFPLPLQLSDAKVLVNGTPIPLFYASSGQVNALIPDDATGLVKLGIQNGAGSHTVNVFVEAAVPAIFTQDNSGKGPAAALSGKNNMLVTTGNPMHAGEYLELFLTGLGLTTNRNSLDFANQQPTVTISGKDCPVSYAGRAPGWPGLDQINCLVPAGLTGDAPIIVTAGSRTSNVATIAVQ
jgi:uncharacterized protein (TIGR03437 family)